jgi:hypothetical protein
MVSLPDIEQVTVTLESASNVLRPPSWNVQQSEVSLRDKIAVRVSAANQQCAQIDI